MIMIIMNCFCGIIDRLKAFDLNSRRNLITKDPRHRETPTRRD